MNFKKLGAALLTISMAATFVVAPAGNVNAATYSDTNSFANASDYVTTNKTVVATYTNATDYNAAVNEFKASAYYDKDNVVPGSECIEGYDCDYDYIYETVVDEDGDEYNTLTGVTITVYKTEYTNIRTKKTYSTMYEASGLSEYSIPSKITAHKGEYTYINLEFENGAYTISNLKSSKKKVAAVKVSSSDIQKTTSTSTQYTTTTEDTSGTTHYWYMDSTTGKWVETTESATVNDSYGSVTLRIEGKKAGTTKVTFNVLDNNGNVVKNAKITVKVTESQPIKSLTFAGKDLLGTSTVGDAETKRLGSGKNGNLGYSANTTSKKSGKLKVKMNKNYKLVALYYGVLTDATDTSTSTYSTSTYKYSSNNTYSYVDDVDLENVKADLNGDGDTLDTVNGIDEDNVTVKYSKIKNNKKIKLSKVGEYNVKSYNYTYGTSSTSSSTSQLVTSAPTYVKVVYYDKVSKQYGTYQTTIYKKINKTYK